jgi:precorrin-8X/cobalt-precorrin-8 methylmutase
VASLRVIEAQRPWTGLTEVEKQVAQRLVHVTGDLALVDELFFSPGAVEAGVRAILRCRRVVTDVPVVESALSPTLLQALNVALWCGVHEREVTLRTPQSGVTVAAVAMRLAYERFGNDVVLAIGAAADALEETLRLIQYEHWRPQLVIGLPAGFVDGLASKHRLRQCMQVPRLTNTGPKGGALWAAAVIEALLLAALQKVATAA